MRLLLDSEGKVQKTYQYDAFGNEIQRSSEERYADNPESRLIYNSQIYDDAFGNYEVKEEKIQNRFGFAGEVYDPQVGLYYLRARFYNPVIGRFIQEDTYYGDGLNLYAYCHNNPVEYVDPSGHEAGHPQHKNAPADLKKNGMSEADANNQHKNLSGDGEGSTGSSYPEKYGSPYSQLSPKQKNELLKKLENRTITQDEYKQLQWDRRFGNCRKRGVNRFWAQEREALLNGGSGTRNWNQQQREDIINRKTPQFNEEPIEGHHKYNAIDYPQIADDPNNIYPATNNEHFERWHGGNYQNDTSGVPLNPDYPEEF